METMGSETAVDDADEDEFVNRSDQPGVVQRSGSASTFGMGGEEPLYMNSEAAAGTRS